MARSVQALKFKSDQTNEPRVLVKAAGKGNLWWAQRVPEKTDEQFSVTLDKPGIYLCETGTAVVR